MPVSGWDREQGPIMDYPTAWAFVATVELSAHEPLCSYVQTNRAVLCDCRIIGDEYTRRARERGLDAG